MSMKEILCRLRESTKLSKFFRVFTAALLGLYIFSLPSFSGRSPCHLISYFIMGSLVVVSAFYIVIYSKHKTFLKKRLFCVPLFVLTAIIGTAFFSHDFRGWFSLFLLSVTFFTLYFTFDIISNDRYLLYIIVVALFAFSLYFLFVYCQDLLNIKSIIASGKRLGGYFDNVNQIGFYMSLGVLISLYLSILFRNKFELLFLISTLVFFAVGFLTGSRTFVVTTLFELILLLYIRFKNHKLIFVFSLVALIILFILLINLPFMSFLKKQLSNAFYTIFGIGNGTSKIDHSSMMRVIWQEYGFYMGVRNIFTGYGFNGFAEFSGVGTYTHGNLSEVFCDFGIFGVVIFYSFIFVPFLSSLGKDGKDKYLVMLLFALYLIDSFLSVFYYSKAFYLSVALMFYLTKENPVLPKKPNIDFDDACTFYSIKM